MFFKSILSIDIGNYWIKIVIGKKQKQQLIIENTILLPTPHFSIHCGKILDLEKIKNTISPFLNKQELVGRKVVFSLESPSMIKRELILPYTKQKHFKRMLSYEIQQHFPTNLEQYIIQYRKIEDLYEGNIKKARVLVVALPKKIIKDYLILSKQLKIIPICLETHASAISKLLNNNIQINKLIIQNKTICLIDLGYENITIKIFEDGIYQLSQLISLKEKNIKNYNAWLNEISRILEFYNSRKIENKIDKIYIYGGHANEKRIVQTINDYFHIPVSKIEKVNNIKIENTNNFDLSLYLNAIAAIIRK
ncbi:type IV pilus biogenesis protein PilM [Crassaminicella indica]|uniref:Pilus assembly protein PilM n=1 Tax=Crassaminicella indica TaxID=2855394 RepID=A0ABX8RAB3_9CLOT|nr:pilus assembly protein PilM [Crassaminicella indica]QXM06004.1 pilus assembly protein PilM [Crassaminicella indica]